MLNNSDSVIFFREFIGFEGRENKLQKYFFWYKIDLRKKDNHFEVFFISFFRYDFFN